MFKDEKVKYKLDGKTKRCITAVVCGTVLLAMAAAAAGKRTEITDTQVERPDYGETQKQLPVQIYAEESGEKIDAVIELDPREYSAAQISTVFDTVYEKLLAGILKDNEKLSEISSDLNLVAQIEGIPVTIQWYSSNYDVVDYEGHVHNEEMVKGEGCPVTLTAQLSYGNYQCEYQIDICIVEKKLSEQEQFWFEVQRELAQAQKEEQAYIQLPTEISGTRIRYFMNNDTISPFTVLLLGSAAVTALCWGSMQQQRKIKEEREKQLQYDYSEMISKLTLLIGAGMTVRRAWEKIVTDYQKGKQDGKIKNRYVYEEMAESLNQMRAGIPERMAYEHFGQQCNTKEYLKFSTLLVQNMKKGAKDFTKLLALEAADAFENRKNLAKKQGEQAGTKLLVPMIMMLAIVMIIIMVPAMLSFKI